MVRHDAAEEKLWDRAAALTSAQLGVSVSRGPWLRLIANRAAKAITEADDLQGTMAGLAAKVVPQLGKTVADELNERLNANDKVTPAPMPPQPQPASRTYPAPTPMDIAALRAIAQEGGSEDIATVKRLRMLGLVDGEGMPTDRGMDFVMQ